MHKKILFLTNTYFQLIVAIQLRNTILEKDDVDVIITNHSSGCEAVYSRLKEIKLFRNVFFVEQESRKIGPNFLKRLRYFAPYLLFKEKKLKKIVELPDDYEEIWFNNSIMLTHLIWFHCPKASLCRFEEGFSTYTKPMNDNKIVGYLFRVFFGDIEKKLSRLYLFHPEFFFRSNNTPIFQIPLLNKNDIKLKEILNYVFDYHFQRDLLDCSYIFLEESFRRDGENVQDVELVKKIADTLGKDNIVVKRHPRSNDDPFALIGIKTTKYIDNLPWEVIQMNQDIKGKKLISISSGSILASALYFQEPVPSFLLFRCISTKPYVVNEAYEKYIETLKKNAEWIFVPESFQDFITFVKK